MARPLRNTLLAVAVAPLLLLLADRTFGWIRSPRPDEGGGLIFTPGSRASYRTPEFTFTATINQHGFRGDPIAAERADLRVLAIGDSFTFGYGVGDEDAWPAVLERRLRADGTAAQVANLGQPGVGPTSYADLAERAIPRLRPHVVVVAVTLGNDQIQLWWQTQSLRERLRMLSAQELPRRAAGKALRGTAGILKRLFPNLAAAAEGGRGLQLQSEDLREINRKSAAAHEAGFSRQEKARLHALDSVVLRLFREGGLNPSLVYYAVKQPEAYLLPLRYETSRGERVVTRLAAELARISVAAKSSGSRVLVIGLPMQPYVSAASCAAAARIGYVCAREMYESATIDRAAARAAERAGLPFVSLTPTFRAHAGESLFFELDGHPTRHAHRLIADRLAEVLSAPASVQ